VQETSRTAHALVDEVARAASEDTDRNKRQQEETLKNFQDPFQQAEARARKTAMQAPGNLQSAGQGGSQSQQASGKSAGKPD
jgi:hypothetical protein